MTVMHLAAQRVKADDIHISLEAGADPLTRDNLGRTPLHFSMFNLFPEVFQVMFVHDVVLKLSRLFRIDALTVWTLCYEQSLTLHCVTRVTKGLIINYYC